VLPDELKFTSLNSPRFLQARDSDVIIPTPITPGGGIVIRPPDIIKDGVSFPPSITVDGCHVLSTPVTYDSNIVFSISDNVSSSPNHVSHINETENTITAFSNFGLITNSDVVLDLPQETTGNLFDPVEFNENLFYIELMSNSVKTISSLDAILLPLVSRDLLMILTAGQTLGKKYSDDWAEPFKEESSPSKPKDKTEGLKIHTATFKRDNTHPSDKHRLQKIDFFEAIFPLLMPPPIWEVGVEGFIPAGKSLHKYQEEGVDRLLANKKFLLADEMGTGKTVISITAMRILFRKGQIRNCLILCPVGVMRVWADHIFSWGMGELRTVMVRGQAKERNKLWKSGYHVFISSYETYRSDYDSGRVPQSFDLLILDEAQNLKSSKTSKYHAVKKTRSIFIWAVTGTPLENKVDDVKSLFELLVPKLIQAEEENPNVIRQLIQPYMLRRLKKDVLKELPPKVRETIWLQMDDDQRQAYERVYLSVRNELIEHVNNRTITKWHIFQVLNRLKQICNFAPNRSSSPKSERLIELLEEITSRGNKVIVFSQYVDEGVAKIQEIIKGYGSVCLTGKMPIQKRDEVIDTFRANPNIAALAMTIKTGGVGLTLTEASYVVHFDHWYNPAVMTQAEDRVHRKGQKANSVTIYEFWMEDTYEEKIYQILEEKRRLAEYVIDYNADGPAPEDEPDSSISTDEWLTKIFGIPLPQTMAERQPSRPANQQLSSSGYVEQYQTNLAVLKTINPLVFERLAGEVMRHRGYPHVMQTQQSSDGGVDLLLWREIAGKREIVVVQCKRYAEYHTVGVGIIRELLGVVNQKKTTMPELQKGILITSSDVSPQARSLAAKSGGLIEVINGVQLAKLITDYQIDLKEYR